jgi:hypothetical protein
LKNEGHRAGRHARVSAGEEGCAESNAAVPRPAATTPC